MNAQKILPFAIAAAFLALPRAGHAENTPLPVSKANLPAVAAAKATGNANAAVAANTTLDKQAAKVDALAKAHADAKVAARIATDFVPMAGTPEKAQAIVRGLHTGAAIRVNADADAVIGARAKLGWGHTVVSLALARELLARHGIRNPSIADLRVALLGGDLRLIDGSLIPVKGVLQLRGLGLGWQRIADMLGVDPDSLLRAVKAAETRVADTTTRQASDTSSNNSSSNTSSNSSSNSSGNPSSSGSSNGSGSNGSSNGSNGSGGGNGTTNASNGSGNGSSGSPSSLVRANDKVLDQQAALIDRLAKTDATSVITQLSRELSSVTGSEDTTRTLLQGLSDGSDSLIRTGGGDGAPGRPRVGRLGMGGAFLVLAFARDLLVQNGIAQPDASQLRVALLGGTLERADGRRALVNGILRLRLRGVTFGEIAQLHGIRLGHVMVAVRSTTTVLAGLDHRQGVTQAALNAATRESAHASADLLDRVNVNAAGTNDALVAQRLGLTNIAANAIPNAPGSALAPSTAVGVVGGVAGNATATVGSTVNGAAGVAGSTVTTVTGTLGNVSGTVNSTTGIVGGATAPVGSLVPPPLLGLGPRGK